MHIDRPIAIALILFAVLLIVMFLVIPEYNMFKSLQTELGEKTAEYNAEHDYYSAIDATYFSLQDRQKDVDKVDNALPPNSDFGQIIYYLQKNAQVNGLVVKDLFLTKSSSANSISAVGAVATSNNVKGISFSMDLSGSYPSLENFIVSLESSARIFEISSISFDSISGPPYNFNLQIKTYSY